jgi:peptidoglycan/xylan/chitin deacetylase (PgdA/CDA1 family)
MALPSQPGVTPLMRSFFLRLAACAAVLGPLACSGDDASPQVETQPNSAFGPAPGATTNQPKPTDTEGQNSAPPEPGTGDSSGSTPPADMSGGTPPSEGQPTPVLNNPAPPATNTGEMPTPPADPVVNQPPPVTGPLVPPSTLPPFGAGNVPQPAGAVGNFRVLNWAGFKAAISFTFDDTNASQIQHYPDLNSLGVPLTFYLITAANHVQDLQSAVWPQALRDGHEIGNHTANHMNAGSPNLAGDTDAGKTTLERTFGITVYTMAAPFGAQDYINIASTRYLINRGTPGGTIAANDNTNPFNLPCFIPNTNAPVGDFNAKTDAVRNAGTWQTELVHGFTNSVNDGAFQPVDIGVFQQAVRYAKSFGDIWIDRVMTIGAYWRAQKALSGVTPTTANGSSTWTWTLPDHFPPGQYLRVTVSGGTLKQGNATVPWDAHGYYEISLDLKTLTLSQ